MKNLFNILAASLVTCLVLASCGKVETPNNGTPGQKKEPRVISLAFASTRTTLGEDGYTPTFAVDDQIKISNGTGTDDCPVKYDATKGYYYIETSLEGPLTAVYPVSAYIDSEPYFQVPSIQDGTFANANICKAVQSKVEGKLVFYNQTAILRFYVDESIGVTQIEIDGTEVATGENKITVTPLSPNTTLYNVGGDPDDICYVAISATASGTTYDRLTLTSVTTTQTAYADNTVTREIQGVTLKQNEMYNAFIPYYIDLGDAGKWGYCNVGAFLPEEFGKYFAWGDTVGQTWTGSQFSGGGFSTTPDVGTPIPEVLPLEYDAAAQNWGSNWRMPTVEEYMALLGIESFSESTGPLLITNECWIKTVENKSLVFPIAGVGEGNTLMYTSQDPDLVQGSYWSSSYFEDFECPYPFFFSDAGGEIGYFFESYYGMSVRPIYAGGDAPDTNITGDSLDPYGKDTETF